MTKKLLQINITANWGSHGKIAEGIGNVVMSHGWESHVAYGRWANPSSSQLYHIGSMMDERIHGVGSRLFDNHGLMSKRATIQLLNYVEQLNPDIIHLHNIHGYYLNYPELTDKLFKLIGNETSSVETLRAVSDARINMRLGNYSKDDFFGDIVAIVESLRRE